MVFLGRKKKEDFTKIEYKEQEDLPIEDEPVRKKARQIYDEEEEEEEEVKEKVVKKQLPPPVNKEDEKVVTVPIFLNRNDFAKLLWENNQMLRQIVSEISKED